MKAKISLVFPNQYGNPRILVRIVDIFAGHAKETFPMRSRMHERVSVDRPDALRGAFGMPERVRTSLRENDPEAGHIPGGSGVARRKAAEIGQEIQRLRHPVSAHSVGFEPVFSRHSISAKNFE